jgi:hypothetical protein
MRRLRRFLKILALSVFGPLALFIVYHAIRLSTDPEYRHHIEQLQREAAEHRRLKRAQREKEQREAAQQRAERQKATQPCAVLASCKDVSRSTFGDNWPLTVDFGRLECTLIEPKGYTGRVPLTAVMFTANGTVYAVNGIAHRLGKDIDEIWSPGDPVWITLKTAVR